MVQRTKCRPPSAIGTLSQEWHQRVSAAYGGSNPFSSTPVPLHFECIPFQNSEFSKKPYGADLSNLSRLSGTARERRRKLHQEQRRAFQLRQNKLVKEQLSKRVRMQKDAEQAQLRLNSPVIGCNKLSEETSTLTGDEETQGNERKRKSTPDPLENSSRNESSDQSTGQRALKKIFTGKFSDAGIQCEINEASPTSIFAKRKSEVGVGTEGDVTNCALGVVKSTETPSSTGVFGLPASKPASCADISSVSEVSIPVLPSAVGLAPVPPLGSLPSLQTANITSAPAIISQAKFSFGLSSISSPPLSENHSSQDSQTANPSTSALLSQSTSTAVAAPVQICESSDKRSITPCRNERENDDPDAMLISPFHTSTIPHASDGVKITPIGILGSKETSQTNEVVNQKANGNAFNFNFGQNPQPVLPTGSALPPNVFSFGSTPTSTMPEIKPISNFQSKNPDTGSSNLFQFGKPVVMNERKDTSNAGFNFASGASSTNQPISGKDTSFSLQGFGSQPKESVTTNPAPILFGSNQFNFNSMGGASDSKPIEPPKSDPFSFSFNPPATTSTTQNLVPSFGNTFGGSSGAAQSNSTPQNIFNFGNESSKAAPAGASSSQFSFGGLTQAASTSQPSVPSNPFGQASSFSMSSTSQSTPGLNFANNSISGMQHSPSFMSDIPASTDSRIFTFNPGTEAAGPGGEPRRKLRRKPKPH
jgi:hypothetical protein